MDRRTLLKRFVKATGAFVAGVVTVPLAINAFSPLFERREGEIWRPLGSLDDFAPGTMSSAAVDVNQLMDRARSLQPKGVYVWRSEDDEIVVFSKKCTDLSCTVAWDSGNEWFFCPCHGGIFAKDGEQKAGPPQRPLYRYATRVEDDMLEIDLNSVPANI